MEKYEVTLDYGPEGPGADEAPPTANEVADATLRGLEGAGFTSVDVKVVQKSEPPVLENEERALRGAAILDTYADRIGYDRTDEALARDLIADVFHALAAAGGNPKVETEWAFRHFYAERVEDSAGVQS